MPDATRTGVNANRPTAPPEPLLQARPDESSYEPAPMVLAEQRAALETLNGRSYRRPARLPTGRRLAPIDRSRLLEVGIRVLTHAMISAEIECRHIVASAEALATTIIQDARHDVERLDVAVGLGRDRHTDPLSAPVEPRPGSIATPATPATIEKTATPIGAIELSGHDGDVMQEFFESISSDDVDPWGFMDDDDLVGVGPRLRRALRRPASTRQPPIG